MSAAAALCVVAGVVAAVVVAVGHRRALRAVRERYAGAAAVRPVGLRITVVESARPQAFSLPPSARDDGLVVVSRGMLDGLDDDERAVLMAHERSHLRHGHHRLITVTRMSAVLNPVLWPLLRAQRFAVERWADEDAAAATGDRRLTARAVGRAALLARSPGRPAPDPGTFALGVAGVVPRRVASLLVPSPPTAQWIETAAGLVALASTLAALEGVHDLGHLLALWSKH